MYQKKDAIIIPSEAVIVKENKEYVYLVDTKKNVVNLREVVRDHAKPDYSVIGSGLQEGESVVVSPLEKLKAGSKVEVLEVQKM